MLIIMADQGQDKPEEPAAESSKSPANPDEVEDEQALYLAGIDAKYKPLYEQLPEIDSLQDVEL